MSTKTGPGTGPTKRDKGSNRSPSRASSNTSRQRNPSKNRAPTVNRTVHKEAVMNHKVFIVGNSELASHVAALLDATLIAAVTGDASLENFKGIMAGVSGLVKVAFIDCWAPDFSATPEQVIIPMSRACSIVTDRCVHHSQNKTSWFNELNTRITEMSKTVRNSTAMSLANTVRNPLKKDRHCWVKWAEYVADDDQSMKH
jgi:hypothetical protein